MLNFNVRFSCTYSIYGPAHAIPVLIAYAEMPIINPGGGFSHFFFIRRLGPRIYRSPKKNQEFQATPKNY